MKRVISIILMVVIITTLSNVMLPSKCWAWVPPSYWNPTTVDGDISEWDLTSDFFANMYQAGNPDKPLEAKAYLRYDCVPNTLYVLVLFEPGITPSVKGLESSSWAAIGTVNNKVYTGKSGNDGTPPDFASVGLSADGLTASGYEASFQLDTGAWTITISSTSAATTGSPQTGIGFNIICLGEHPLAIHINKYISLDNQASWIETTIPPGPTVVEGTELYFKFVISNSVNIPLYNITLTDSIYDLSGISLPTSLAPENEPGDTFTYILGPIEATSPGQHTNRATTSGQNPQGTPQSDSEVQDLYYTVISAVQSAPSITVQKYVSEDDLTYLDANDAPGPEVDLGAPVYFKFVVTNSGNVPLGDITLTDNVYNLIGINPPLPSPFTLEPGTSYTGVIGPIYEGAGQHTNTATATGYSNSTAYSDTDSANFSVIDIPVVQDFHLKLTKSGTLDMTVVPPNDVANVGDTINYTLVVINDGTGTLSNVTVIDTLLTGSWGPVTLNSGQSATFTGSYILTQEDIDRGYVDNTATATAKANDNDIDPVNATNTQDISQNLYLSVTKDSTLDMTVVAPDSRGDVDDKINYTLLATNTGNVTLTNVTIFDPLLGTLTPIWPNPSNPGTLLIGQSAIFTGSYTLTQNDINTGFVDNTATADSDQTEQVKASHTQDILQILHMSITKSGTLDMSVIAPGDVANEDDEINYIITVTNDGNVTLTNVTVYDPLLGTLTPTWPGPQGELTPGQSATFNGSYSLNQGDIEAGHVYNTATADSDQTESVKVSNTQGLPQDAYLTLTKSGTPDMTVMAPNDESNVGDKINYIITVTNDGNLTLTNVTVSDPLLGTLTPTWPDPSNPGTLLVGQSAIFTGSYTLTEEDIEAGNVLNTATADSDQTQPIEVTDPLDILLVPHLSVTKSAKLDLTVVPPHNVANVGDKINYIVTITNDGSVTLTDIAVSDPLLGTLTPKWVGTTTPGTLHTEESVSFYGSHTLTQVDIDTGYVLNTATGTGIDILGKDVTDQDSKMLHIITSMGPGPQPNQPSDTVGGDVFTVNKTGLIAPWIGSGVIILAGGIFLYRRRVHDMK